MTVPIVDVKINGFVWVNLEDMSIAFYKRTIIALISNEGKPENHRVLTHDYDFLLK